MQIDGAPTVVDTVKNFRGLAGLPAAAGRVVRSGVFFRSGHLGAASDADLTRIASLGIRTVLDLRSDHDIEVEGEDRLPRGAIGVRVPVGGDSGLGPVIRELAGTPDRVAEAERLFGDGRAFAMARHGAERMVTDPESVAVFASVLRVVSDPVRWPVLWHCSAGKDRAGWVGTALLLALGTPPETIEAHYVESNTTVVELVGHRHPRLAELLEPFVRVQPEYVRAQLAAVDREWGGPDGLFVDGFGWSPTRLANFRRFATL